MEKITPCLWFDFNAREAVDHYLSIFKDGKIHEVSYYGAATPGLAGKELTIRFEVKGQTFLALNGGPQFPFTEAISIAVNCEDQAEIDRLWDALAEGGAHGQCGWLKDKFGLSWQVAPADIGKMLTDKDPGRSQRVFEALMPMTRIDISTLRAAYEGKEIAKAA